jgi:hypothetical protein
MKLARPLGDGLRVGGMKLRMVMPIDIDHRMVAFFQATYIDAHRMKNCV